MRKTLFFLASLILLSSCYHTYEEARLPAPDNLIPQDSIVLILADVEIAESVLRQKQNLGHEINDTREAYYHAIFTTYGVTKEQFDSSMIYYRQDMETINAIYEEVITRLSVIESEVQHE